MPVGGAQVGPGISGVTTGGGGSGTVTSVSVVTANGFAGTVANPTTTPAITVQTSVTGITKGNGTALSAAVAGTDYTVSVTAADGSIVIGGSAGNVTVQRAALTGDATAAAGSNALTLATVNSNVGTFGSGTAVPVITANGKGLITAVTTAATVGSVAATDASITVTGTATAPTISRAALTGDATAAAGSNATTVVALNGTNLAGLATGLLKNTTGTGVPVIATAGTDYLAPLTLTTENANFNAALNHVYLVTTGAGTITGTLPAPAASGTLTFKKVDTGAGSVVISQHAAETIDGQTTQTITAQNKSLTLISDGTNWFVI